MINTRCISTEKKLISFCSEFCDFFRIEDKKEYYLKKTLCCFLWKAQTMQKLEL